MVPEENTLTREPNKPIRLVVGYKTAESALTEFTRSIGKGTVALPSRKKLPVGTRFVFELRADGVRAPVEVSGEVTHVTKQEDGRFLLTIRYQPGTTREGVDALLQRIFDAHRFEKIRKHPRVPLSLRATEDAPYSPAYVLRDIARGGLGMDVEAPVLPATVRTGQPFLLELGVSTGALALYGEIVWTFTPPADRAKWISPSFGVAFGKLRAETYERLERIVSLRGLPPPPWRARVSFGMSAVGRMP